MFFYIVLKPISTIPVYEVPAIRVNTSKLTHTFTSVGVNTIFLLFNIYEIEPFSCALRPLITLILLHTIKGLLYKHHIKWHA